MAPASPPAPESGIVFPLDARGQRATTQPGTAIVGAALGALDAGHADAVRAERDWRHGYPRHFHRLTAGALASPEAAVRSAAAGLDKAWATLQWRDGERDVPLAELDRREAASPFRTHTVRGQGAPAVAPWHVPYRGRQLAGAEARALFADWQARGILEPSAAAALGRCLDHPEWFDLSDRTLVLLGAGSEAGPLPWLLQWRANVVAVDIARAPVWERLERLARAGNGVLHAPLARAPGPDEAWTAVAGADLLTQAPGIRAWVAGFAGPLDIAAHAYVDGERHVRVVAAMDFVQRLAERRPGSTLAFMATPTDVFAVPAAAVARAQRRWDGRSWASRSLHRLSGGRFFQPNVALGGPAADFGVVDSLVIQQGPNYALAKRLQQWRATVARQAGVRVSLNVAPSTMTASVLKNPALAAGFAGADAFGVESFAPETTNALMAALWVHDLRAPGAAADPATPLVHPFALFTDNAIHGGLWQLAFLARTALPFAAALGWARQRTPWRGR